MNEYKWHFYIVYFKVAFYLSDKAILISKAFLCEYKLSRKGLTQMFIL